MNSANMLMLIVLIVLTILMSYKNISRMKEYKKDKVYIDLYTKVLKGQENVNEELEKYISEENDPCLNTKARIVKAYNDILSNKNPSDDLKLIEIKNIYYINDKFSIEKAKLNSEIMVWLTLMLSKARCLSMIDLMNELFNKVEAHNEDLKVLVEYQVFKAAYNSLLEKGTDGIEFLKKLLQGDYSEYVYDKNLIGIYKKIACCLLVFTGEPIDESDEEMLPEFTGTLVGNRFTRDLEIYDKYAPKDKELNEEISDSEDKELTQDEDETANKEVDDISNLKDSNDDKDIKDEDEKAKNAASLNKDDNENIDDESVQESIKAAQDELLDSLANDENKEDK